jgi:hypothetical protein
MPPLAAVVSVLAILFGPADDPDCHALGGLDVARAAALADVNLTELRAVYASASAAAQDERILKRYAARGYRIEGAGMVRDQCRVVARWAGRLELDVTEHLAPAWIVSEDGASRRLPRDRPRRHHVILTGRAGRWRIASVG